MVIASITYSCGFDSQGTSKSNSSFETSNSSIEKKEKIKISDLTQEQIRNYAKVNSCYLPLVKDSTLYPDNKRSFYSWQELFNDSLSEDNSYRNRYLVGDFMVLDENLQTKGIEEKNPDLLQLVDFKKYDHFLISMMDSAVDYKQSEKKLFDYIRTKYPSDSLELLNFYRKIWQYKTPTLNKKVAIINNKAYALGQKLCLCEAQEDTLLLISQFSTSAKSLIPSEVLDEEGKVVSTSYVRSLPLGKSRHYYGAQYLITSKNWETQRAYERIDQAHDNKLGGGNNRVTFFKTGAQLPNFLLMTPSKDYPKAMRQNGIHEVALSGLSRGMLGSANSIGCIRVTDFGSKFIRWWVPQNAKFFVLYAENKYFSELPMSSISDFLPFKNEGEGNAFRKWLIDNKPLKAAQLEIDLTGRHDNGHILEAYNLFGAEYEVFRSKGNE
ncbi:MAG: hypothetical protein ACK5BR_03385 [Bacteroidota bacterium]|jgi:hypothetical protein|nr:hypothetical protein [Algoriphagus sp.]